MSALQPVRGTHDILPDQMRRHRLVTETARALAERYGYLEITTPMFEFTEVFKRSLGDTSDVVTKEMYTFSMKEGEQITLRPEATAGVARALNTKHNNKEQTMTHPDPSLVPNDGPQPPKSETGETSATPPAEIGRAHV